MWFSKRRKKSAAPDPLPAPETAPAGESLNIRMPKIATGYLDVGVTNIYNTPNMLHFPKRRRSKNHRSTRG